MSEVTSPVRIVTALPGAFPGGEPAGGDPHGILRALADFGPEARVEPVDSIEGCADAARGAALVVLDGGPPASAEAVLALSRAGGPPVVAVVEDAGDPAVVDWFERGVADCVVAGDGDARALAVAALEQICRAREAREQREVEERLTWLENLNATIVTEIPAALAVLEPDHRLVMANPAFSRAFGETPDALRGRQLVDALPSELLASGRVLEMLARVRAGEPAAPGIARCPDGERGLRSFDVRAQRLDDAGRLLLVLSDITARETLAKRIEDLQRYNENIIQNLNSALLVVDTDGGVTFANAMAAQILGEPDGSLRGRSIWDWFSTARSQEALLEHTLQRGARYRGAETILTRAEGTVVPIGMSCAPLVDADGSRLGAVAIFQDLTEITMLQRQVLQTEKMASIGQLAAGVAHEINNPMGFIHANLFQMAEYLTDLRRLWSQVGDLHKAVSGGEREEVRRATAALQVVARELDAEFVLADFAKAIRESQEGSERIRHIVWDLRDFSRQDTESRVPADINQCLDSTANIVWSMMKHLIVLKKRYADLPQILCYPMQLKQVFMNLLVNAYQAIEARVRDGGERGEIELVTELRGPAIVVSVSDNGVGIPLEQIDRIFDPFFTTKEVGAGTGLGLSTSYNIIRKHGGALRAANRPGHGATFEVTLPLAPREWSAAGDRP